MNPHEVQPAHRDDLGAIARTQNDVGPVVEKNVTDARITPVEHADVAPSQNDAPAVPVQAPVTQTVRVERPARVLLGWLPDDRARLMQVGMRADAPIKPEHLAAIEAARSAIQDRAEYAAPQNVITDATAALDTYIGALRTHATTAALFADQYRVAMVDLTQVCAAQPSVYSDHTAEMVASLDGDDPLAVAKLTMPLATPTNLLKQFDPTTNTWMISAPNPNLRVLGPAEVQATPGMAVVGFGVAVPPSFMVVARIGDRFILKDGYHRAYALLQRGIHVVPAFVREFTSVEQLGFPAGMLPVEAYLGPRPPLLTDYFKDNVSIDVQLSASLRIIVISALAISPNV